MVSIALLTVSDTRNTKNDESGNYLLQEAEKSGHNIFNKIICKDDIYLIRKYISDWISDPNIDVIITTGGTGITARDVTPEAVRPLLDKEIDGFGETFRFLSFKKIEQVLYKVGVLRGLQMVSFYSFCLDLRML